MLKTAQKITIARRTSDGIMFVRRLSGRDSIAHVHRGGVQWNLDLREGIDLAIYLLGGFERSTLKVYKKFIVPGSVVLDIGANIGAHTLPLAILAGEKGSVYAFEPTEYAYTKLLKNIQLNPLLSKRIIPMQMMLVSDTSAGLEPSIYSSWPMEKGDDLHPVHLGRLKSTRGARVEILDRVMDELKINHVDLIKIDVDGHESSVLKGAYRTLKKYTPVIMMELAPYIFKETQSEFTEMIYMLHRIGYSFTSATTGKILPKSAEQLAAIVPDGASMNIIASTRS
jgi:FkbM family methyltransferase